MTQCINQLNPVVTTAQALQVEQEGSEMDITGDIKENTVILGSNFSKNTVSPGARKKYFSHLENLKGYSFEPGVVWTFGRSSFVLILPQPNACMFLVTIFSHHHNNTLSFVVVIMWVNVCCYYLTRCQDGCVSSFPGQLNRKFTFTFRFLSALF